MYRLVEAVIFAENEQNYKSHVDVMRVPLLGSIQDAEDRHHLKHRECKDRHHLRHIECKIGITCDT